MGRKSRYSGGAKYANGNYKAQQKAYNKTTHGLKIRIEANKCNEEMGKKGDGKDCSHTHKGVILASESANRGGKGPHKRRKPRKNIA